MRPTRRLRLIELAFAVIVALLAAPAWGQPPPPPRPARPPPWLEGFDRDADDLPRAIDVLERGGGLVTDIRFDGRGGHPGYDAAVERDGHVVFVRLARGAARYLVLSRREQPVWMQAWRPRAQRAAALNAKVGLSAAVKQAETDAGNLPAVAAAVATRASDPLRYAPAYNVLVLTPDDAVQRVAVDARTGLSIADLGALASWPQPLPYSTLRSAESAGR
jgi:hypothetical protein